MNEELQKQLAELLASLMNVAKDGAQWAKGEIPLLVQEKIALGRFEESIYFFAPAIGACVLAWLLVKKIGPLEIKAEPDIPPLFSMIFGGIATVMLVVGAGAGFHDFAMVWFAPRLYIVEWLTSLVKA